MRINYDFNDLEAFLAIMELTTFQQAAQQLNISQSAITRRIKKLEDNLGVQLFERTTRSVKPTLAAKRFQQRAQALLDEAQEASLSLRDETAQMEYQRRNIITIAAVSSTVPQILTQAIKRYRAAGYQARIRIIDRSVNDVSETVVSGEADLGISFIPSLEPNLEFERITEDRIVLAVNATHPLADKTGVDWADLEGYPLILPMKGTGNRMLIDEVIARNKQRLHWTFEVRRGSSALEMVKAGLGVATLPASAITDTQLKAIRLGEPEIIRSIGVITRSHAQLTKEVKALLDCLRTC